MYPDEVRIVVDARLQGGAGGYENRAEHLTSFVCPVCREHTFIAVHPKAQAHVDTCGLWACMETYRKGAA